jgi:hypothetical protein
MAIYCHRVYFGFSSEVLALETVPEIADKYVKEFEILEWISVVIFTIDYIAFA